MRRFSYSLVLLALLAIGLMPAWASAQTIAVYFDAAGTQRFKFSPGVNQLDIFYVYGEGFGSGFVSGVQYKIDYGPDVTFIADGNLPAVSIGRSNTGIAMGFGLNPRPAEKFLIQTAVVIWATDCSTGLNNQIVVGPHPLFPDPTPMVSVFPTFDLVAGEGLRSLTCSGLEIDIRPLYCPNTFPASIWSYVADGKMYKGGWLGVAVLGTASVDVNDIDKGSITLNGVAPLPWPQTTWFDVALADGDNDCKCDFALPDGANGGEDLGDYLGLQRDGFKDLLLFFRRTDIAASIGPDIPHSGAVVPLNMEGLYNDGTPLAAADCIKVVGGPMEKDARKLGDSDADHAGLGYPSPNPFNPVTRIAYSVPSTQHVNISIYNVAGQLVESLVNGVQGKGDYVVEWDASSLPSGVYFYRLKTASETIVRRATLLK